MIILASQRTRHNIEQIWYTKAQEGNKQSSINLKDRNVKAYMTMHLFGFSTCWIPLVGFTNECSKIQWDAQKA